jgi:hypothetical protein
MFIFKFMHSDRIEFFNNLMLRFSQPGAMNDLYECLPSIKIKDPHSCMKVSAERRLPEILFDVNDEEERERIKRKHLADVKKIG